MLQSPDKTHCFTKMQLLKKLGISYYTLEKLFKIHGEPPFFQTSPRVKYYDERDIQIWFDVLKGKAASDYDRLKNMLGE